MTQLIATLYLLSTLMQAGVVYPQAMKVHSVDKGDGLYTVTLRSGDGNLYAVNTESGNYSDSEIMAVIMYDSMTPNDPTDDAVIGMRRTGWAKGD